MSSNAYIAVFFSLCYDYCLEFVFNLFNCVKLKNCCDCHFSDFVEQDIVMYVNSPGGSVTAGKIFFMYLS